MNEIVMGMQGLCHGWLLGFEAGVAVGVTVVVIAVTASLGRAGKADQMTENDRERGSWLGLIAVAAFSGYVWGTVLGMFVYGVHW